MQKYTIIGNMTGNSMDAADFVLTEFKENDIRDVCAYSKPFSKDMQLKMEKLRQNVLNKNKKQIEALNDFKNVHDEYVRHVAAGVLEMCEKYRIDKKNVDAIGFHGKTLDHNPPSKASTEGSLPYTLQIGSGKMLADLTKIKTVYDFRSDLVMKGFEGAPLVGPHNAHIALIEGDGIYYNGGNTSNFAVVDHGEAVLSSDAGPCNEYIDAYARAFCDLACDKDGMLGQKGALHADFLQKLFDFGRTFYETPLAKSGDPAYYRKNEIFKDADLRQMSAQDALHTFEYFAAYIAAQALTLVPENVALPENIILFGGGWKNPVVRQSFEEILGGKGFVLKEHRDAFEKLQKRFKQKPTAKYSAFGTYMEARLMADLAYYKLCGKTWNKNVVCGVIAEPQEGRRLYDDLICRAAKGWQG